MATERRLPIISAGNRRPSEPGRSGRSGRYATVVPLTAAVLTVATLSACGSSSDSGTNASAKEISVAMGKDGCVATPAGVPAGSYTFKVKNTDADSATEVELLAPGGKILGEKENLTPGLSGSFSLALTAGKYQLYCPHAGSGRTAFIVSQADGASASPPPATVVAATTGYHDYIVAQVALLQKDAQAFADAVKAGDVAKAKELFAPARFHYETVEPVAESFGDLDPDIDARENDVDNLADWTGFHRIEKTLYDDNSLVGMAPYADGLMANVNKLAGLVATAKYQPAQLANGSVELLDEVAKSKITGEEDRYSHTDLSDFVANVAGAQAAYTLLEPVLAAKDPALAATIDERFADLNKSLDAYKTGDTYVNYSAVTEAQRKALSQQVDALAEPLSQVAAKVA
jgi:iron uptake system component EfeO